MAKIKVTPDSVSAIEHTVRAQAAAMEDVSAAIGRVLSSLDMKISGEENIRQNLNTLRQKSKSQQQKLEGMDTALTQVIDQFQGTDKKLSQDAKELGRMCDRIRSGILNTSNLAELIQKSFPVSSAIGILTGITQSGFLSIQEALKAIQGVLNTQTAGTSGLPAGGQELYEYLLQNDPKFLFSNYNDALRFMNDIKGLEALGLGFSDLNRMFKSVALGISAEDMAEIYMNDPKACKAILRGIIDDLSGTEYLDLIPSNGDAVLKGAQELAEMCGYDDSAEMIEMFRKITGTAEEADKILKDYSANISMLESLRDIAPNSSVLTKTVDKLIKEYQNQFKADVVEKGKSYLEKGIYKVASSELLGSPYGTIKKVLDNTLGKTDTMQGLTKVVSVTEMRTDAINGFQKAAEKIRSGNFTEADMLKYQNSFNVARSLTIEQYKGMLEYYGKDTSQGRHIAERLSQLEQMTYQNFAGSTGGSTRSF